MAKSKTVIVAAAQVNVGECIETTTGMRKVLKVEAAVLFTAITIEDPASRSGKTVLDFGPTATVNVQKVTK